MSFFSPHLSSLGPVITAGKPLPPMVRLRVQVLRPAEQLGLNPLACSEHVCLVIVVLMEELESNDHLNSLGLGSGAPSCRSCHTPAREPISATPATTKIGEQAMPTQERRCRKRHKTDTF